MQDDDLALLGVGATDRRKLEAMGLTTLEQIVLLDRYSLGLGKGKSDNLVKAAANILGNRHFREVLVEETKVVVDTEGGERSALLAAAKEVFGTWADYKFDGSQITIGPGRVPYSGDFNWVLQNARRWQSIAAAKGKDQLRQAGITLGQPELVEFGRQRGMDGFINNVFGEIKGNELMKRAIAAAMFASIHEPLHTLVVGAPGSGKTMARDIIVENFSDIIPIGANSTRAGLVCNRGTGELGSLANANGKLALIDEFDKLNEDDIQYTYELFSNGKCQVDAARIHTTIESHFTAIAFANPQWETFKGRPMDEIGIRITMLSRFALIVPSDMLGPEVFGEILARKLAGESELTTLPQFYDQWVKLARLHKPLMKASQSSFQAFVNDGATLYQRYVATALRRDIRLADYLPRLARSIARAEFSDVTDNVLERAIKTARDTMKAWG